ncbi:hypothetical protein ACLB2K_051294 [Fragaria x ananassa]
MPEAKGERYYSSYLGWVMSVSTEDMKVSLFNPLKINESQIELPDFDPSKMYSHIQPCPEHFLKKFVLSSSPSRTSDYIIMVLGKHTSLGFCRPGDKQWRFIDTIGDDELINWDDKTLNDIIYYKGQFYVVGRLGTIFVCEIEDPQQPKLRVVFPQMPGYIRRHGSVYEQIYLVESAEDLFVVSRFWGSLQQLTAFKVPLSDGNWWPYSLEVRNLGKRTLFIGSSNSSVSIDTGSNSECRANCMYFPHSIYDMKRRESEPQLRKIPKSLNQRLWIQPSF